MALQASNTSAKSSRIDKAILSLADALWPPLPDPDDNAAPEVVTFCRGSGSDYKQVASEVIKVIDNCFSVADQRQLKLLLWLMSSRWAMLLLAGRLALSRRRPWLLSLPEMPLSARQALLHRWSQSRVPALRKAYKALKALIASALMSHIDPATGTNPFYAAIGYTPGNKKQEPGVGPAPAGAAEAEELLASATIHLPAVAASSAHAQAYLTKRGFATSPAAAAGPDSDASASPDQHKLNVTPLTLGGTTTTGSCTSSTAYDIELHYDVVVVGSGAGGGVSAALLAAAGMRVLVLEKAGWMRRQDMSWLEAEAHAEMYERAGFLTTADGGISILAGSTLGGGTKINWTASLKTPDHVRREWASAPHNLDILGPDSQAFTDALEATCQRMGVHKGTSMSGPNAKLLAGLQALGLHGEELPRNCLSSTCSAYCNFGCRSGHKQSSDVCWLVDAVKAGAQLLTGVEAQHILTQQTQGTAGSSSAPRCSKKVSGLFAISSPRLTPGAAAADVKQLRLLVHAPLVVASCGSIHTPALLLRSGITAHGNVGRYLRLHPAAGMVGFFERTAEQAAAGRGPVNMHEGVSMGSFSRAAAAWSEGGYGAMVSVPAAHPGLLAALTPDPTPGSLKRTMLEVNNISTCVIFTRDSGSGRVTTDSKGQPVLHYWPCETTQQHLLDGLELAVRALVAAGAVGILVPNGGEDWSIRFNPDDSPEARAAQLEAFVSRMRAVGVQRKYTVPLLSAHQMGSCRMGSNPKTSACDSSGQCWEVSGLYVADASIFPTASGVNPMMTIYGLAYLVASGIAERWKRSNKAKKANGASNGVNGSTH